MRAHVLGNGPSWSQYQKIDYSDFVIGCNKPNATVDATVIMDLRFFYKLLDRVEPLVLDCAIITNQKCKDAFESKNRNIENIRIMDVYSPPEKFGWLSSAHIATLWLIENNYKEIHIWGCDAIKVDTIKSTTDSLVDSCYKDTNTSGVSKVIDNWREKWDMIVNEYPEINITFHNED